MGHPIYLTVHLTPENAGAQKGERGHSAAVSGSVSAAVSGSVSAAVSGSVSAAVSGSKLLQ